MNLDSSIDQPCRLQLAIGSLPWRPAARPRVAARRVGRRSAGATPLEGSRPSAHRPQARARSAVQMQQSTGVNVWVLHHNWFGNVARPLPAASSRAARRAARPRAASAMSATQPLQLQGVIGFGGDVREGLVCDSARGELIYPLGSTVVLSKLGDATQQEFLRGHSDNISCLTISPSGKYLASGQVRTGHRPSVGCGWGGARGAPRDARGRAGCGARRAAHRAPCARHPAPIGVGGVWVPRGWGGGGGGARPVRRVRRERHASLRGLCPPR